MPNHQQNTILQCVDEQKDQWPLFLLQLKHDGPHDQRWQAKEEEDEDGQVKSVLLHGSCLRIVSHLSVSRLVERLDSNVVHPYGEPNCVHYEKWDEPDAEEGQRQSENDHTTGEHGNPADK